MTACAFCGRDNEPASRYCIDCGKPLSAPAARAVPAYTPPEPQGGTMLRQASGQVRSGGGAPPPPARELGPGTTTCPRCSKTVDAALPFCGYCGTRVSAIVSIGGKGSVVVSVLDDDLAVLTRYSLDRGEAVIGRGDADITLDDVYLSPVHARLELREGVLWVRDLGSRNGTWTYIEEPTRLADGDVALVGSQRLRFRRLGYPGPHPPEADSTRRMGSLTPPADVAVLEQLRADGSVRDSFHLSPTRTVHLGRESGDWVFPYDQTMSGRHAEIQSQDADFYLVDSGSRNGVALAVRGERAVRKGQRILLGDQILRIESVE
ncbi:MAG: FHA domain-containing protein [Gemmatimonadaceae bacterium]